VESIEHSDVGQSPSISRRELTARLDKVTEQSAANHTKQERAAYYEKAALAVITEYLRIKSLSPIVASNPDPEPLTRSQRLTFDLVGYAVDIEHATEKALEGRPDLQSVWFSIALGEPVQAALRNEVSWRCGRIYSARRIEPWKYWRRGMR
jgi:hypothetical protein